MTDYPVLRVMTAEADRPAVGGQRDMLGVRLPPSSPCDVAIDTEGYVVIENAGMSVNRSITEMPIHVVPARFNAIRPGARGSNLKYVWLAKGLTFGTSNLSENLQMFVEPADGSHGVIRPRIRVTGDQYQQHLASTIALWEKYDQPNSVNSA